MRRAILVGLIFVSGLVGSGAAAEVLPSFPHPYADPGDSSGPLNNPQRNEAGTPYNQDYFAAGEFSGTRFLVWLVESGHLNKGVFENFSKGWYSEVLQDLDYTLEHVPNHPHALTLLGSLARLDGTTMMPISRFEKALSLYPQHALTHGQYGYYLVSVDMVEEGLPRLNRAIEMDPTLAVVQAWVAEAYFRSGRPELGREHAARARSLGYANTIREEF